jgi:hypothetical protein
MFAPCVTIKAYFPATESRDTFFVPSRLRLFPINSLGFSKFLQNGRNSNYLLETHFPELLESGLQKRSFHQAGWVAILQFWYVMKLLRWLCTTSAKFCTSGLFQNGVLHFTARPEMASFQKTGKSPNVVCSLEFPIGNFVAAEFWSCNGVFKSFHLYQFRNKMNYWKHKIHAMLKVNETFFFR